MYPDTCGDMDREGGLADYRLTFLPASGAFSAGAVVELPRSSVQLSAAAYEPLGIPLNARDLGCPEVSELSLHRLGSHVALWPTQRPLGGVLGKGLQPQFPLTLSSGWSEALYGTATQRDAWHLLGRALSSKAPGTSTRAGLMSHLPLARPSSCLQAWPPAGSRYDKQVSPRDRGTHSRWP